MPVRLITLHLLSNCFSNDQSLLVLGGHALLQGVHPVLDIHLQPTKLNKFILNVTAWE